MNTLNLSVDNALTSQQIIHQLITKTNEIVENINNLQFAFIDEAKEYTDKAMSNSASEFENKLKELSKELLELDKELKEYIERAIKSGREYTDLKAEDLQSAIDKNKSNIEDVLKECKFYTDEKVKVATKEIELLSDKLDLLVKNSVAVISPLDGSTKNATAAMYDMLYVFQRGRSFTWDQFISLATYFLPTNNSNDKGFLPTNIDTLLSTCNEEYWENYRVGTSFTLISEARKDLQSSWSSTDFSNIIESKYPNTIPPRWGNIVSNGMYALGCLKTQTFDMMGESTDTVLMDKLELVQSKTINIQVPTTVRPSVVDNYTHFYQLGEI